jgi:hypothetical protein
MHAIRIRDLAPQGFLGFDLKEILAALGPRGLSASWAVSGVVSSNESLFATGEGASALERLAVSGERLSGRQLAEIAQDVVQVIWGEFRGYEDTPSENPWVVMVAVDSSWWEVRSPDATLLDQVAGRFKSVERLG